MPAMPRTRHRRRLIAAAAALALAIAGGAAAQTATPPAATDAATLERLRLTTLGLIEALVTQGLLSRERADALLRDAERHAERTAPAAAPPGSRWGDPPAPRPVQRVPFLSNTAREELRSQIRTDVLNEITNSGWADPRQVPSWTRRVSLGGDVRLRAQSELFGRGNLPADQYRLQNDLASSPAWAPDLLNTTEDRHRLTLRARLGADIRLDDQAAAGLRITTGGTSGPASASATLGNHFNRLDLTLDRAFLRWNPNEDWRWLFGRFGVPFMGGTLVWPDDLSLDGVLAERSFLLDGDLALRARAGAFPLQEFSVDGRDKWLFGAQLAMQWDLSLATRLHASVALYDFHRIEGVRENDPPPSGPRQGTVPYQTSAYPAGARLKGNTLINLNDPTSSAAPVWGLASRFRPLHLSAGARLLQFYPWAIGLSLDWVKNLGFDLDEIERRAGDNRVRVVSEKTSGLELRGSFGTAVLEEPGQWQVFAALRRFERDAWPDAFTDTTWHGGGTSYQGWSLGGTYVLTPALRLGARWTSTRNLDDGVVSPLAPSGTLSSAPLKLDLIQIDLSSRF
jgi:hypothetical protein